MTSLSVNLNKVALLRNQRDMGYPSVIGACRSVIAAGADGITIHPRQDQRHIRGDDVRQLAELLAQPEFGAVELNVEGFPSRHFLELIAQVRPQQVTLVPDAPDARTSDSGWNFDEAGDLLEEALGAVQAAGARASLFIDPDPEAPAHAAELGAERIELYTGAYAAAHGGPGWDAGSELHYRTCRAARVAGIGVNAGHDLNRSNLGPFLEAVPWCLEVSIGHALTADALDLGWSGAVAAYRAIIAKAARRGEGDGEPRWRSRADSRG